MEIRRALRGENIRFSTSRPAQKTEGKTAGSSRASTDRVELSRQWLESLEEQRARMEAAMASAGKQEDEEGGLLGYMETEQEKLDGLSEQLDMQMKCMKIAANMMKGKRVPPEDERYLMEHDPEGYKLAVSMRSMGKEDDEECESVLKDEDKQSEQASGDAAPAEVPSGGGEAAVSGDGGE